MTCETKRMHAVMHRTLIHSDRPVHRPAILIPNYNHKETIAPLLDELAAYDVPCLIVNDGSEPETRRIMEEQERLRDWVKVLHLARRGGKGAAVVAGLLHLDQAGYTHALQLDADGQHNPEDAPRFLQEAEAHPLALILGKPAYGPDVPKVRLVGRQLSRILVWMETLSLAIGDPLLGYRVYPVEATALLCRNHRLGLGMDFDPEVAVRLFWAGVPVRNVLTRVLYPRDSISHFRMFRDNALMVWLHVRLMFGMIARILILLRRKAK